MIRFETALASLVGDLDLCAGWVEKAIPAPQQHRGISMVRQICPPLAEAHSTLENPAGLSCRSLDATLTSKGFRLICRNSSQVSQIALVSNKHDDNVAVGVVAKLLEPSGDVDVCRMLSNVVYEQSSDGTTVVCRCDGTVSLLSGSIPDLSLDCLSVYGDGTGGELDTDGGLGLEAELVASESREKVGFTRAAVTDQNHLEEVVVVGFCRHDCRCV